MKITIIQQKKGEIFEGEYCARAMGIIKHPISKAPIKTLLYDAFAKTKKEAKSKLREYILNAIKWGEIDEAI